MSKDQKTISSFQLFFFIVQAQLGVGVITLPASVFLSTKQDAWISVFLTGIFSIILLLLYSSLLKRFEGMNGLEICSMVWGKWIGKFCAAGYGIYFLFFSFLIQYAYINTLRRWILLSTPHWIIFMLMMLFGIYYGKESEQKITRFCQLSIWSILFFFVFSIGAFKNVDVDYLLPVIQSNGTEIWKGMKAASLSFFGFECVLIMFPLVHSTHKEKVKAGILAITFVTFVFLYITVLCTMYFSPEQFKFILEPTLFLFKTLTLFDIIERLDLIFLSVWFFIIIGSYIIHLRLAHSALHVLKKENKGSGMVNILLNLVIFGFGMFVPESKETADFLSNLSIYVGAGFVIIIPILLLLSSYMFKRSGPL